MNKFLHLYTVSLILLSFKLKVLVISQVMPPKLECVLPTKLQKGDCPTRFFNRFEIACNCMQWTEEDQKARQVLLLLGDDVFDYACSLPLATRTNYTNLKKSIITKYEGGNLQSEYTKEFQLMKWKRGEDLTAFLTKMKKVAKLAYPDFEEAVVEKMVIAQFTMAMPDEVRKLVYLSPEKAESGTDLVEQCEKFMKVTGSGGVSGAASCGGSGGPVCSKVELEEEESKLDKVLRKVEALSMELEEMKGKDDRQDYTVAALKMRRQGEFRGNCYRCGRWGHSARDCSQSDPRNRPKLKVCESCNNPGHSKFDCALNDSGRCRKCGNLGHNSRDCRFQGVSKFNRSLNA